MSLLSLGVKEEGKFKSYGDGLVFLSKDLSVIKTFVQESGGNKHRSISFQKVG
jgi:hypothetical protein